MFLTKKNLSVFKLKHSVPKQLKRSVHGLILKQKEALEILSPLTPHVADNREKDVRNDNDVDCR